MSGPARDNDPDCQRQQAVRTLARLLMAPIRFVPLARNTRAMYSSRFAPNRSLETSVADLIVETVANVNVYYTPVLVVLGSAGNLLSVYVFYNSKLRRQSTSQYLTALALSDTLFLMQLLPPWLTALCGVRLFQAPVFCQVFMYCSYVSSCLSSWLVVGFTVERFVAVTYPLRRTAVCTRARARFVVWSLVGGAAMLNLPVLWFAQPSHDNCTIDDAYLSYAALFNILDALMAFTAPLSAIVILNACIVYGVVKMRKAPDLPSRSQQRVTVMVLIVSTVFVALNMPAYIIRIFAYAWDMRERDNSAVWEATQQLALMFFNTNFGINIVLYCLSGQNFRSALLASTTRASVPSERARRSASCSLPLRAMPFEGGYYGAGGYGGLGGGGGGGGGGDGGGISVAVSRGLLEPPVKHHYGCYLAPSAPPLEDLDSPTSVATLFDNYAQYVVAHARGYSDNVPNYRDGAPGYDGLYEHGYNGVDQRMDGGGGGAGGYGGGGAGGGGYGGGGRRRGGTLGHYQPGEEPSSDPPSRPPFTMDGYDCTFQVAMRIICCIYNYLKSRFGGRPAGQVVISPVSSGWGSPDGSSGSGSSGGATLVPYTLAQVPTDELIAEYMRRLPTVPQLPRVQFSVAPMLDEEEEMDEDHVPPAPPPPDMRGRDIPSPYACYCMWYCVNRRED